MLNKIVAAKPADLAITMHICRGNFRSTWFSAGGYEPIGRKPYLATVMWMVLLRVRQ